MNIKYRVATLSDISSLSQMRTEFLFVSEKSENLTKEEFINLCEEFFQDTFNSWEWIHFVAENEDNIVSIVSLQIVKNLPTPSRHKNKFWHLTNIYTKPAFRKNGISSNLIQNALEYARENGIMKIMLWSRDSGMNLYKSFGFSVNNKLMELNIIK